MKDDLKVRMMGFGRIVWHDSDRTGIEENEIMKAIEQTEWSGDGFPPSGTTCEVKDSMLGWIASYIVGMDSIGHCVYEGHDSRDNGGYQGNSDPSCFRPLKTERERVIVAMADYLCSGTMNHADQQHVHEIVEDLYDNFNINLKDK